MTGTEEHAATKWLFLTWHLTPAPPPSHTSLRKHQAGLNWLSQCTKDGDGAPFGRTPRGQVCSNCPGLLWHWGFLGDFFFLFYFTARGSAINPLKMPWVLLFNCFTARTCFTFIYSFTEVRPQSSFCLLLWHIITALSLLSISLLYWPAQTWALFLWMVKNGK